MIHLDTNVLIGLSKPDARFEPLFAVLQAGELVATSAIVWQEFMCGPFDPAEPEWLLEFLTGGIVSFDRNNAELAAHLYNSTGRRRNMNADCLIAAIAMQANATLFTFNTADFRPFEPFGLRLL